jgi:putative endonuclease
VKTYHVYIISNASRMLYVGVMNDIHRRMFEHKRKLVPGFSQKYNLHELVYWESFGNINDAIAREKAIKGSLRAKKIVLIRSMNPQWNDLAADWFKTPSVSRALSSFGDPMRIASGSQRKLMQKRQQRAAFEMLAGKSRS